MTDIVNSKIIKTLFVQKFLLIEINVMKCLGYFINQLARFIIIRMKLSNRSFISLGTPLNNVTFVDNIIYIYDNFKK